MYSIVYHYTGAQWYKMFLQVGELDPALIFLVLALYLSSASVSAVFMMPYVFKYIYLRRRRR